MAADSRISATVDFDKSGKQIGHLAAPISTNASAYGTVTIPIVVLKNGKGPTMFFTGGVHGDEYEGPVALMKIARRLRAAQIEGRVIIVPCLNLPAVLAGDRVSPIDGLNLNRIFPGDRNGSITQVIAHYVSTVLLPMTNIQVDIHSGGKTLEYIPTVAFKESRDKRRATMAFEAMKAFGAPIGLINQDLDETGLLENTVEQMGLLNVSTEMGGAGVVSKRNVEIAETGVMNLLKHFGLIEGKIVRPEDRGRPPTRVMKIKDLDCYVMSPDDGLYEPFLELGEEIKAGRPIGQVHYPHNLDKKPWVTRAKASGMLLCKRPPGKVQRGDNVAIIAQDLEPARERSARGRKRA